MTRSDRFALAFEVLAVLYFAGHFLAAYLKGVWP